MWMREIILEHHLRANYVCDLINILLAQITPIVVKKTQKQH